MPAERQYRHPVALTALRPFVRLSRRLERQVVAPAAPGRPTPAAGPSGPAATPVPIPTPAPVRVPAAPPAPAATPAPAPPPAEPPAASDQFQAVDASVVPVPIESLNRLVLAVDELGSEMTQVREAIRELTATLSASQAGFARILAGQNGSTVPTAHDPLAAVSGPYVSGSPSPTPFTAPPAVEGAGSDSPDAFDPASLAAAVTDPPVTPAGALSIPDPPTVPMPAAPAQANGLGDLPIVHTGEVQVVIGPIAALEELDDAVDHIGRINGVENVSVTAFEGSQVVLTAELSRALPLASLLRTELGRDVASCRLVDGRIVVDFGDAGRRA